METLPTDNTSLSQEQRSILTRLFGNAPVVEGESLLETLKVPLIVGALTAVSNFPGLDDTISRVTGISSPYILMLVKGAIAVVIFWLVQKML